MKILFREKIQKFLKILACLIVVYFLLNSIFIASFSLGEVGSSDEVLTFVSYNVEYGIEQDIINKLSETTADIIALQEAFEYTGDQNYSLYESIDLAGYNHTVANNTKELEHGLVVLTKWDIVSINYISFEVSRGRFDRGILHVTVNTPLGIISVINTHLAFPAFYVANFIQVNELMDYISDIDMPTVLLGDFNSHGAIWDISYIKLSNAFNDAYIQAGNNPYFGKTWRRWLPISRVDHVFISNHWGVARESFKFFSTTSSDHFGITVSLYLSK